MSPEPEQPARGTESPPAAPEGTEDAKSKKESYTHRRTGNVARLEKKIRDQINQLLLDGVPYAKIIERIGEAGKDLDPDNIRTWKAGGFEDWLLEMKRAEDLGHTRDAALSLVGQKAGATVQDAGRTVASAQLYELLLSFNPRAFAAALLEKPELYFKLVNAISRLSESEAECGRHRAKESFIEEHLKPSTDAEGKPIIPADQLMQLVRLIKLV